MRTMLCSRVLPEGDEHIFRPEPFFYSRATLDENTKGRRRNVPWKRRNCVNISIRRLCTVTLSLFTQQYCVCVCVCVLRIWIPRGTAVLVRSLPMKRRKSWLSTLTYAPHADLVNDVTVTDCRQTQYGNSHGLCLMVTFKCWLFNEEDYKSTEKLQVFVVCLFVWKIFRTEIFVFTLSEHDSWSQRLVCFTKYEAC